MNLGAAIKALKSGKRVYRLGWNGKFMWLKMNTPNQNSMVVPHVLIKTTDDMLVPWTCSQTDLLAEDWVIAPDISGGSV